MNFEKIKNDEDIIKLYESIKRFEDCEKGYAYHDYNHVLNVSYLIKKILEDLGYDKEFVDDAMVAGLLHDAGCLKGKKDHAYRSYLYAKEYLKKNHIKLKNEKLVLEAIKIHSDGFNTTNIIALVLILCDKLDVKYTRVGKEGKFLKGMRQHLNIEDIIINITNNKINIDFKCNDKLDLKELEEYYFTNKIFKGIVAFSQKMNLNYIVTINNTKWNYNIK